MPRTISLAPYYISPILPQEKKGPALPQVPLKYEVAGASYKDQEMSKMMAVLSGVRAQ